MDSQSRQTAVDS